MRFCWIGIIIPLLALSGPAPAAADSVMEYGVPWWFLLFSAFLIILLFCFWFLNKKRQETEERLSRKTRKLNLYTQLIQYEIGANLIHLKGYIQTARDFSREPDTISLLHKADTIATAIGDAVEHTKLLRAIGEQNPVWNDLTEAFRVAKSHYPVLSTRFDIRVTGLFVLADPVFEFIFSLLIDDSLKYNKHISLISLSWHRDDDHVVLVYQDDGIGIAHDRKEEIFLGIDQEGGGHKLIIIREILALLEMDIHETGSGGKGARFEIRMPNSRCRVQ
ncbi:MAG TPA: ATP-binding protein [Methanospirillum sp.]|nr:ATP-binding protein [Methanospirillum sp.]